MPKADGKEFSFLSEDHINASYLETFNFDSKNKNATKKKWVRNDKNDNIKI